MQVSTPTLTDKVAAILMERIRDGSYPVGTKLPSGRLLAGEFDVSPAVIREATERLRSKGLIRSRQGAGCLVLANSSNEGFTMDVPAASDRDALRHIYELRYDIEGAAAALAALRATSQDIDRMETILAALYQSLNAHEQALDWDLKFHQALAQATHNPHYGRLLKYLSQQWRHSVQAARKHTLAIDLADARSADGAPGRLAERVHQEHVAVLQALKQGDPQAARLAAQKHMRNACERLGLDTSSFQPQPAKKP